MNALVLSNVSVVGTGPCDVMDTLLRLKSARWTSTSSGLSQVLPLKKEPKLCNDVRAVVWVLGPIFDLLIVFPIDNQEL